MNPVVPIGIVDTPQNVRQIAMNQPGNIKFRYGKARGADLYVYQRCTGNPDLEASWTNAGSTNRTFFQMDNQPALTNIYWRVASVGKAGQSDWSDFVKTACLQ